MPASPCSMCDPWQNLSMVWDHFSNVLLDKHIYSMLFLLTHFLYTLIRKYPNLPSRFWFGEQAEVGQITNYGDELAPGDAQQQRKGQCPSQTACLSPFHFADLPLNWSKWHRNMKHWQTQKPSRAKCRTTLWNDSKTELETSDTAQTCFSVRVHT